MHVPTPRELKNRRDELALTQSEVAERAGVSQPLIARIEGGDVDPRLSTLRSIVDVLNEAAEGVVRAADVMNEEVVAVQPDDAVSEANRFMLDEAISQLPVTENGAPRGFLTESDIRQLERDEGTIEGVPVNEVMREPPPSVSPNAPLAQVENLLDYDDAVLVMDGDRVVGIVTDSDVLAQFS